MRPETGNRCAIFLAAVSVFTVLVTTYVLLCYYGPNAVHMTVSL